MTKEERDAVYSWCASIDNIIISLECEIAMLRTHLDILTKMCEDEPQTEYDKYGKKIRPHDPHKDWYKDEPQMETPYVCTQGVGYAFKKNK